jgi:class 3 adenylate cyclase
VKRIGQLVRAPFSQRAFLGVLILVAVVLQGAYLYNMLRWQHAPDRGWIFMIQLGPDVVAITRPLGYQAGLREGDVILRLNGSPYQTFEELWSLLDYEIGHVNTYEVRRGDEMHTVEIENHPLGFRRVFMQSGVFWTLGTLIAALGFLVFAMKPFHGPSWAFMVLAVLLGIVIPHFAPAVPIFEPQFLNNVVLFGMPMSAALVITLGALFPQRKVRLLSRRRWLLLPYLVSLALGIASRAASGWVVTLPPTLLTVIYLYILSSVIVFLGLTLYDYTRTQLVAVRLQALVIFTGLTLSFLLPIVELVANLLLRVSLFPNMIVAYATCLFFFPFSIGYAIARHDLFEISTVVRRTYGYILSTGAVVGAYGIVLSVLNLTAFANISESRLFSVGFLLLVAFSFEPIHRRSQGFVDRVFYRQRYDYRSTIRQISEAMTSILDPGVIHKTLLETLVNQMLLENGVLLLPDSAAKRYRKELAVGGEPGGSTSLAIAFEDLLLETLESDQNPLFRHDVDLNPRFAAGQAVLRERFTSLAAEVIIAMKYQSELIGVISLGQKKSGRMFTLEDLDLLKTITAQTAIAMQNAKLFDQLSASVKRIQILESIKTNLEKFVPRTVQDLIEEAPDGEDVFKKREKDVTVMFADITGYTSLSSQLPLDEVNALVERYFGAFLDEILKHGGDVNETSGDGLMVLFQDEDPVAHARAAMAAALAIQHLTGEINVERAGSVPIGMHIGVNSGTASVGATKISAAGGGDRWTYTASGPTTNIAARVGALGHEIVVTEETRRRMGEDIQLEDLGPQSLKNVEEPIRAYRVTGAGAEGAELPAAPKPAPPAGEGRFRISGVLRERETGRALPGLLVRAFDQDLLFDDRLGEAISDAEGTFEIRFTEDLIGAFEKRPDIYLRVFDASGSRELATTAQSVRRDAGSDTTIDVAVPRDRLREGGV